MTNIERAIKKIQTVLDSDLTAYRIAKEVGYAGANPVHDLRSGKADIYGMKLSTAMAFEKLEEEIKMNYSVVATKTNTFTNIHGMKMKEDIRLGEEQFKTANQAEKRAKEFYEEGADRIFIKNLGGKDDASRYHNAREGVSPVGKNWAEEFEAGYEV